MQQPEAKFKKKLNGAFERVCPEGWHAYVKAVAKNGVPDLFYQLPHYGGTWVEAKVNGNTPSSAQLLTMGRMARAGASVVVVELLDTTQPPKLQQVRVSRMFWRTPDSPLRPILSVPATALTTRNFWELVLGNP
jgi:hypothetical protein